MNLNPSSDFYLYDVGALGGIGKEWKSLSSSLNVVLFEPNQEEIIGLKAKSEGLFKSLTIVDSALAETDIESNIYITENPQCTSILQPNISFLKKKYPRLAPHFEVIDIQKIKCRSLSSIIMQYNLPHPDVLKIDVQGFELDVLKGSEAYLPKILAIRVEVQLEQLYLEQPLMHEIHSYLLSRGFVLRKLIDDKRRNFSNDIVELDAIYINKNLMSIQKENWRLEIISEAWGSEVFQKPIN